MLVLSRKLGQRFKVGEDIEITIVKIDRHSVRIGVAAPCDLGIYREELQLPFERVGTAVAAGYGPRPK